MRHVLLAAAFVLGLASTARAEGLRELCPSRPGLNTPPCTVDKGHVLVELGLVDWTRDTTREGGGVTRTDELDGGQLLVHVGLDDRTEVQLGWTAVGHVRTRDASGVSRDTGTGDVTLALRRGLAGANGPVAIQPYVTLPVGGSAIGLGDYSAGVLLPVAIELTNWLTLGLTPELDWLPNTDGDAHHAAFGSAFALTIDLSKAITASIEGAVTRDTDPSGSETSTVSSASLAWQPGKNTQFDLGVVKGGRHAPDVELYVGVSRRF